MERSNAEIAALYAAMKEIERQTKGKELPPGNYDLSHVNVTIVMPEGTSVYRDPGANGDGTREVKATANLYGYATWAAFLKRLAKFNQANVIRAMLIEALQEALNSGTNVETELSEIDPELAAAIEELRKTELPTRIENTVRQVKRPKDAIASLMVNTVPLAG